MRIQPLSAVPFKDITNCFNLAFSDYLVTFEVTEEELKERWHAARIDYDLSFVAMENKQPVGFIIIGIDQSNQLKTAFNGGTGVVPNFRGTKIVDQLYQHAIPFFLKNGVEQCSLEVISNNFKAIRVYERIGFHVCKALKCYKLEKPVKETTNATFTIKKVKTGNWKNYELFWSWQPSWECNSQAVPLNQDAEVYEIFDDNKLIAYFVITLSNNRLLQFAVAKDYRRNGVGQWMLQKMAKKIWPITILNVDEQHAATNLFLLESGFLNFLDQYEMKMRLYKNAAITNSVEQVKLAAV